jgi:hypothetical protein
MRRSDPKPAFQTWGIFLQSTGELLGTAKSRIGAVSRSRKWSKTPGYLYIDRIVVP